jgi:hypothetical protein
MLHGLIYSRRNRDVNKQRRLIFFSTTQNIVIFRIDLNEGLTGIQLFNGKINEKTNHLYTGVKNVVYRCLSFCTFSFGYCVVYSSSIYGFWLPLWYLQTLLSTVVLTIKKSASSACIVEHPSRDCSTSDTHRVNLVTNPVISHEWGKDREVLSTIHWFFLAKILIC